VFRDPCSVFREESEKLCREGEAVALASGAQAPSRLRAACATGAE